MADRRRVYLQWWIVPGAITLLLLLFNSPWVRLRLPDVIRTKQWVFSLYLEMNFAVWWSSIIYLLSAALFYEIASGDVRRRRPYLELSLLMLALVIDEVGSIHEWVSGIGGWTALMPFALFGALLLGDSLRLLWRDLETRPVAWLVLIGFLLMASVALQEYAEHNWTTAQWSEWYGRFIEETTELVGAWIILTAAVYRRQEFRWGGPPAAVVPDPTRMARLLPIIVLGLIGHLVAAQLPLLGVGQWDARPSVIYPSVVFFLLACYAFWVPLNRPEESARSLEVRGFWSAVGLFFLTCSVGSMQNLWGFVGKLIPGLAKRWFYEKFPIWVVLIVVVWCIGLALWQRRDLRLLWLLAAPLAMTIRLQLSHVARGDLAYGILALLCAIAILRPDSWSRTAGSIESTTARTNSDEERRWKT